jgi:hypothetical protein
MQAGPADARLIEAQYTNSHHHHHYRRHRRTQHHHHHHNNAPNPY